MIKIKLVSVNIVILKLLVVEHNPSLKFSYYFFRFDYQCNCSTGMDESEIHCQKIKIHSLFLGIYLLIFSSCQYSILNAGLTISAIKCYYLHQLKQQVRFYIEEPVEYVKDIVIGLLMVEFNKYLMVFVFVLLQRDNEDEELCSVFVPTNHLYIGDIFLVNSKEIIRPNLSIREGIGKFTVFPVTISTMLSLVYHC